MSGSNRNVLKIFFFNILFFVVIGVSSFQGDLGDLCGNGIFERCVLAKDCKAATDLLKKGRHHGLERCGFQDFDEIVCCPSSANVEERNPKKLRKSAIACNNIKNIPTINDLYILGGDNATLGEFPHIAAIGYEDETTNNYNFECGGSLISDNCILTAAHCLVRQDGKEPKIIRLGKIDLLGKEDKVDPQDIGVNGTLIHESYDVWSKRDDIGIIRLSKPVEINTYVRPICLYMNEGDPDDELVVTGWGKIGDTRREREGSRFLLKTYLKSIPLNECNVVRSRGRFGKSLFDTQFCAVSRDSIPRDTCQGDSGGPLQIEEKIVNGVITPPALVGVTSTGPLCGGSQPGIYTRVSKYLDWIEKMVWP